MRRRANAFLLIGYLLIPLSFILYPFDAFSDDAMQPVIIDGDEVSYGQLEGKVVAKGNVVITSEAEKSKIFCQEAVYDAKLNTARLIGNVKIIKDEAIAYGEDVFYDFNTGNAEMADVRVEDLPIYGSAEEGVRVGEDGSFVLRRGYVTTCDLAVPHYRLVSKRAIIYPGERVVARHVVLRIGNFPVFYAPYVSQSLKDDSMPIELIPGKDKDWGIFLLSRLRYHLNDENKGKVMVDFYEERGVGTGVTHSLDSKQFGKALIKYYQIQDHLYHLQNRSQFEEDYPERININPKYLEDDRYKAQVSYSWKPTPNLSVTSEFNKFSDQYFMKDFFEREYDVEPHPLSYILLNYSLANSSLSLLTQKRMNHFWTETEYLPQLEYNLFRQNLGSSNFYLESEEKMGNINYKYADNSDSSVGSNAGKTNNAFRITTHNILSYVDKIKWLGIEPYAGYYANFYSHDKDRENNVWRLAPEMGLTLSTKLYKLFSTDFSMFGEEVNQMRHIITPQINYQYIHAPKLSDSYFYQFDEDDALSRKETITLTLGNKLQARNKQRTWDFIYFSPSVTYQIGQPGERKNYFDQLAIDFEIYPKEGISLTSKTKYDMQLKKYTSFEADLTFSGKVKVDEGGEEVEKEKYSVSLGHRYQRQDETQGTLDIEYQLTPKVRFKTYLRFIYNTEDLEEQEYAFRVDLHCWWMDIGIDLDRREEGSKDLIFWVAFRLKAYPDINIGFDHTYDGAKKSYY